MKLQVLLLSVLNAFSSYSRCSHLYDAYTCNDMVYDILIDSKVCVDECPSQYTYYCSLAFWYSCECIIPTSPELFDLDFSKIQDLSANCIVSSINPSDTWNNPSSLSYNSATQTSPLPTRSRGFYFSSTSSITSSQNYIPSLYFTSNAWILPISSGQILTANLNSKNYIELIYDSPIFTFTIIVTDSTYTLESKIDVKGSNTDNNWQYLSIQINQLGCDEIELSISRNTFDVVYADWIYGEAAFPGGNYIWTIGQSDLDSFIGFLYWIEAMNSLDYSYWFLDTTNFCSILNYFGQCMRCDSVFGCYDTICSSGQDDCTSCYLKDCSECYGYDADMCTNCARGALPDCCDWLAGTCSSTIQSTSCISSTTLLNGICIHGSPYGFVNDLPVNTPVITADLTQSFTGIYDNIFVTGVSSTSYNFWNSPETIDPIPAKQRGLYFIPNSFLKARIDIYHTFSITTWIYPLSGCYIGYLGGLLKVYSDGSIEITMQDFSGSNTSYFTSTSPDLNSWNFVSYTVKYNGDGTSTIAAFLDGIQDTYYTVPEGLFRPLTGGSFYLGSSDFNGFISLFVLWQWAITDFSYYRSYFDGASGLGLWSCDFDYFYDGGNCVQCLNTCQNGCVRVDSCNICDSEYCLECSSFEPNSCILCEENRSGPFCDCDDGYYQFVGQTKCLQCYTGCYTCSETLYYQCLSCNSGYYFFSPIGACLTECPLGYSNTTNECILDFELIFDLNLNTTDGVVYDKASLIPVITGSSDQFYPNYEDDDPIVASYRGFYFNGNSSVLRLPEYETYISPKLIIGSIFTISIWLNIENESSTIISKNDISNGYSTVYAINLINLKSELSLFFDNSIFVYSSQIQLNSYEWNHLAFLVTADNNTGNSTVICYINTNPDILLNVGFGYFQDINDNVVTLIGAQQSSLGLESFFQGFLYEIKIYNTAYDITLLSQTSCTENCRVCDMTSLCLPNCNITEKWGGPGYNDCLENCEPNCSNNCEKNPELCACNATLCDICMDNTTNICKTCKENASLLDGSCVCNKGYSGTTECLACNVPLCDMCMDDSTDKCKKCKENASLLDNSCVCNKGYYGTTDCLPCNVTLCDICMDDSSDKCKTCKANASLQNNICVCDNGYNGTTECTFVQFSVNLIVFANDSLSLDFSDPLENTLTFAEISILLETGQEIAWSLEKINSSYYSIPTQINEKIEKNTKINLTFVDLSKIKSIYNGILNSSTIIAELNEYDPNPLTALVSAMASKTTATATSSVTASVAISFVNPNPSSLWGLLNCLQILSYLSLSGIPFSENMINFLTNLNSYSVLPNFFDFFIDEKDGNKAYSEAENFGYNTDLILLNQGDDFVIIGLSIVSIPFIIYFAQCSYRFVGKKFVNMLKNYRYGFYIRFWIQCYLELGAAACVGLKMFKFNNWVQITNIIICFGLILLFTITPAAFLWFSYRNRLKIKNKEKKFDNHYNSFFYEFQQDKGLIFSLYYFVYFLRRFIYVLNLVFMNENPKTQVSINMICSLLTIFYLAIYSPFEDRIIQISNLFSEIMIGVIIFITSFYLFDVSSNVISYVENSIIFISMMIIGAQFCASVAIFVRTVYQVLRYKLKLYGNAKLSIHPMEEDQDTIG